MKTKKQNRKINVRNLDMAKVDGYAVCEFDVVKNALIEDGKYKDDLLYRGINAGNISKLIRTGQDNAGKYLFCATEEEIFSHSSGNIFIYAEGAVAVFDPNHLQDEMMYAYIFKNPKNKLEALVAVYKLDYPFI